LARAVDFKARMARRMCTIPHIHYAMSRALVAGARSHVPKLYVATCRELLLLIDTRLRSLLRVTTCCESLVHLLLVVTTLGPLLLVVTHREHPLCAAMRREPLYIARLYCSSHPV
jgi:hypothetical protein